MYFLDDSPKYVLLVYFKQNCTNYSCGMFFLKASYLQELISTKNDLTIITYN